MSEYEGDYDKPYRPYRPFGINTGNAGADFMLAMMQGQMGAFGSNGTFNSNYDTLRSQASAQAADEAFREMLSGARYRQAQQMVPLLSAIPRAAMAAGGQPWTPEQTDAFVGGAGTALSLALPGMLPSAGGRMALDAVSGGNAIANYQYAMWQQRKRMIDPVSLQLNVSNRNVDIMAQTMFDSMRGGSEVERLFNMQGFNAGDLTETLSYMGTRGGLASGTEAYRLSRNKSFMDAVATGRISQDQLKEMGLEGIERLGDMSLDSQEIADTAAGITGNRAANTTKDALRAMSAIRDTLGSNNELIDTHAKLIAEMERFTSQYNNQLSGKQIGNIIRETDAALSDLGYNYASYNRLQSFIGSQASQFGYQAGAVPIMMANTANYLGGATKSQMFNVADYGGMSVDQAAAQNSFNQADFGKSNAARGLAAILYHAEAIGDAYTSDAAGERSRRIIRNLRAGVPTGDAEFDNATPMQRQQIIAAGQQGDDNLAAMMRASESRFGMERYASENNLYTYAAREQRREFERLEGRAAAERATGRYMGGMSGSDQQAMLSMLSNELTDEMLGMGGTVADRKVAREVLGTRLLNKLNEQVANGTPEERARAQAMLNQMGSTPEERAAAASRIGFEYLGNVESLMDTSALNVVKRFGDEGIAATEETARRAKVRSFLDQLTPGATNTNLMESITGLLSAIGEQDGDGNLSKELAAAFKTSDDATRRAQVEAAFGRVTEIAGELEDETGLDANNPQDRVVLEANRRRRATLLREAEFLQEELAKATATEEAAAATAEKTTGSPAGSENTGGKDYAINGNINVQSLTLVIDGEQVTVKPTSSNTKSHPRSTGSV